MGARAGSGKSCQHSRAEPVLPSVPPRPEPLPPVPPEDDPAGPSPVTPASADAAADGVRRATAEELFLIVYEDLRRLARSQMARQAAGHTLQPTALVNEAYLKLSGHGESWQSPAHFMRVAARAMRQILVDHGRARAAEKRLPEARRVDMESLVESYAVDSDQRAGDLVALDRALVRLEQRDPLLVELIELHFFGGRTMAECAVHFGVSERNVFRWWRTARAFLHREVDE